MAETADQWSSISDHIKRYKEDPVAAHDHNPYGEVVPTLLLNVRGRKSGKVRSRPLVYGRRGDDYIVVASMGGAPESPQWFHNIMADPDCEIQVKTDVIPVRARLAEGAERDELWSTMASVLPQYAEYQTRTTRQIPVVVLERRTPTGSEVSE